MYSIKTEKLTKKYTEKTAVSNLDLKINEGEMYGLLGVNGAGKTTTMKGCRRNLRCIAHKPFGMVFKHLVRYRNGRRLVQKPCKRTSVCPCRKCRKRCNFGQLFGHYARTYPRLRICGCVACSGCGRLFGYDEKEYIIDESTR